MASLDYGGEYTDQSKLKGWVKVDWGIGMADKMDNKFKEYFKLEFFGGQVSCMKMWCCPRTWPPKNSPSKKMLANHVIFSIHAWSSPLKKSWLNCKPGLRRTHFVANRIAHTIGTLKSYLATPNFPQICPKNVTSTSTTLAEDVKFYLTKSYCIDVL